MISTKSIAASAGVAAALLTGQAQAADERVSANQRVHYRYEQVGDVRVFYREAGDPAAPAILLLHGFAASSYMWRDLIPALADRYHVIAPDLPGFGFTESPERGKYEYSFANITKTIEQFTTQLKLDRYSLAVHDYGAPVGWRLALAHPARVTAIISQNGNAYEEGLAKGWEPIRKYWQALPRKTVRRWPIFRRRPQSSGNMWRG